MLIRTKLRALDSPSRETVAFTNVAPSERFPSDFPENCPPADAVRASGPVFRIVSQARYTAEDFRSYHDLGRTDGTPCRRRAISVYPTLHAALHRRNLMPYLGDAIAEGAFSEGSGRTKLTDSKSGHVAWWSPWGFDRMKLFRAAHSCPKVEQ